MTMFSLSNVPQTASSLFSAYASLAAFLMLIRTAANDLIPHELRSWLYTFFHYLFSPVNTSLTLVMEDSNGMSGNEANHSAQIYLSTKISPKAERLKVSKTTRQKSFTISVEKGAEIPDVFGDIRLLWRYVSVKHEIEGHGEQRSFELSFDRKFKEKVLDEYLPYVIKRAKEIKLEQKVVKLYSHDCMVDYDEDEGGGNWGSINLEHPSTFDTLAIDPELKKMITDDLDRFLRRKEFYKRVGKAWKRGYLLYGPPGTGKPSLIASMANYLKFDVYDLQLNSINYDSELKRTLLSTTNRSILVIEDIDCNVETHDREKESGYDFNNANNPKFTLSGLLNFIDGLWSSCGDERIIIFTTNHRDRLDPALLRPGRMDVHINMSYCTVEGFMILVSNYLGDSCNRHPLLGEIKGLINYVEDTPAEVAEELMKSDDVDVVLKGLLRFLKQNKIKASGVKEATTEDKTEVQESNSQKTDDDDDENDFKEVIFDDDEKK